MSKLHQECRSWFGNLHVEFKKSTRSFSGTNEQSSTPDDERTLSNLSHPIPSHPILYFWLCSSTNQLQAMEAEFLRRGANLEVVRYGGEALHAFTRPEKTGQADKDAGLSYCKHADEDSWRRVVDLLREELR